MLTQHLMISKTYGIFTEEVGEGQGEKYIKFRANYADGKIMILKEEWIRITLYQAFEILPEMNGNIDFHSKQNLMRVPLNSDGSTLEAYL